MSPTTKTLPYSIVDAFTSSPFGGNPAGVLILSESLSEAEMQKIAREVNLSETAFATPQGTAPGVYTLRWFTPTREVALCGHATLAASHAIFRQAPQGDAFPKVISFSTVSSGVLQATLLTNGDIELDFPVEDLTDISAGSEEYVACEDALYKATEGIAHLKKAVRSSVDTVLEVVVEQGQTLSSIEVKDRELLPLSTRCVVLTTLRSDAPNAFHSRTFVPAYGIAEDPVTGSAHCALAPFWAPRFATSIEGADTLVMQASQGSVLRHGDLRVVWDGKGAAARGRVKLRGKAFTVAEGRFLL